MLDWLRPARRAIKTEIASFERRRGLIAPQCRAHFERLLQSVKAFLQRRKRYAVRGVFSLVPAGPKTNLEASAAHLVHGRCHLGEVGRMAKRHRADQRPEADSRSVAG